MKAKTVYVALSRVVSEDKEVIGFKDKPKYKRSNPIYMSTEVICFGLQNKNFEIVDVKLGGNGKPRGTNGFLLSLFMYFSKFSLDKTASICSLFLLCFLFVAISP